MGKIIIENHDWRRTVFLAGSGRSGTTWVANMINHDNRYRYMFEPFHCKEVDLLRNFHYRQYLRAETESETYYWPAKAILSGRIRNEWVDRYNRKVVVTKRLINDIRANLMVKWIKTHFPDVKLLMLLRHPCAVAVSRLKLGWDTHLEDMLSQRQLVEDFLTSYVKDIEKAGSAFEKHIFQWCIENFVPLRQLTKDEYHLVFYEDICAEPEQKVTEALSFLGERPARQSLARVVHRPSETSRTDSAIIFGKNLVESWRKYLTAKQIADALAILRLFGLDQIYGRDPMPLIERKREQHDAAPRAVI